MENEQRIKKNLQSSFGSFVQWVFFVLWLGHCFAIDTHVELHLCCLGDVDVRAALSTVVPLIANIATECRLFFFVLFTTAWQSLSLAL